MNLISYCKLLNWSFSTHVPTLGLRSLLAARWYKITFGVWLHLTADEPTRSDPLEVDVSQRQENFHQVLYKPLEFGQIRILVLHPGAEDEPICGHMILRRLGVHSGQYEALSYVWGDKIENEKTVYIDELSVKVTQSLYSALKGLRKRGSYLNIWIDAICMNQNDEQEKNHLVQNMSLIYNQARLVNVWLGDATEYSSFGMQILNYFANSREPSAAAPWKILPPILASKGLADIMSRPWFQRMWVVQEVVVSLRANLICGQYRCTWDSTDALTVRRFMRSIKFAELSPEWEQRGLGIVNMKALLELLDLQIGQQLDRTFGTIHRTRADLLDIMYDLRHRGATDPRDKVFALASMVDGYSDREEDLKVNYTWSIEQTFEHLTSIISF